MCVQQIQTRTLEACTVPRVRVRIPSGQFNNDGNLDVAIFHSYSSIGFYSGDGSGTFTVRPSGSHPSFPSSGNCGNFLHKVPITFFDFDLDGDLDVLMAGNLWLSSGGSSPTFTTISNTQFPMKDDTGTTYWWSDNRGWYCSQAVGDIDVRPSG